MKRYIIFWILVTVLGLAPFIAGYLIGARRSQLERDIQSIINLEPHIIWVDDRYIQFQGSTGVVVNPTNWTDWTMTNDPSK